MKKMVRLLLSFTMAFFIFLMQSFSIYAESDSGLLESKTRVSLLGKYDSADTASIKKINSYSGTIQFRNQDTGKNYTLSYDNTTHIYDIYGRPISADLLTIGQVVDITFLKGTKHLNSCVISSYAWVKENVTDFNLISNDQTAKINGETLHLSGKALIISDGEAVNPEDILTTDTLRVSGIDKEIYSIVVTRGHGYVSLSSDQINDKSLVGAWIELDKEVIRKITPNMLISAPEGTYNVSISGNGAKFNSEIVVNRNEETVIDTGVISIQKEKEGYVTFYVTPSEARVFVDGEEIVTEVPHSFTYGTHNLHVMADGYTAQDKYLKVAEKEASIFIDLEPNGESDDDASTDESEDSSSEEESLESDYSTTAISEVPEQSSSAEESSTKKKSAASSSSSSASSSSTTSASVDSSAAATTVEADDDDDTSTDSSAATTTSSDSSSTSSTSDSSDTSSSGDSSDEDDDTITGYKISFDAPIGAEAYFDGNYVGIIPLSFVKTAGQHMVTLQREGYQTKSYTIQVDSEKSNVTYSFPELQKESSDDSKDSDSSDSTSTGDSSDSGSTGDSSDSSDTSDTSEASDSADTTDSSDSTSTRDSSGSSSTKDSSDTSDTAATSDSSDSTSTKDASDSSDTAATTAASDSASTKDASDSSDTAATSDVSNGSSTGDSSQSSDTGAGSGSSSKSSTSSTSASSGGSSTGSSS